ATQRLVRHAVAHWGRDFDVLLTPTMATLPPRCGSVWEGGDADPVAPLFNCVPMAVFTSVCNVTGLPAINVPVHHDDASGLPVGVHVIAAPWRDDVALQLATQLELALPWHDRRANFGASTARKRPQRSKMRRAAGRQEASGEVLAAEELADRLVL